MKTRTSKRLTLHRDTLLQLDRSELRRAEGGGILPDPGAPPREGGTSTLECTQ